MLIRLLSILFLFLLAACAMNSPIKPGEIPTLKMPDSKQISESEHSFATLSKTFPPETSGSRVKRVDAVINQLFQAAKISKVGWRIHLLRDERVKNVAVTAGRRVFVWTGVFKAVRDDDELAAVIAHELAHVMARHERPTILERAANLLPKLEKPKAELKNDVWIAQEIEADYVALFLMADAGYDPEKGVQFWKRMANDPIFKNTKFSLSNSHPAFTSRLQVIAAHLGAAKTRFALTPAGKKQIKKPNVPLKPSAIPSPPRIDIKNDITPEDSDDWIEVEDQDSDPIPVPSRTVIPENPVAPPVESTKAPQPVAPAGSEEQMISAIEQAYVKKGLGEETARAVVSDIRSSLEGMSPLERTASLKNILDNLDKEK